MTLIEIYWYAALMFWCWLAGYVMGRYSWLLNHAIRRRLNAHRRALGLIQLHLGGPLDLCWELKPQPCVFKDNIVIGHNVWLEL